MWCWCAFQRLTAVIRPFISTVLQVVYVLGQEHWEPHSSLSFLFLYRSHHDIMYCPCPCLCTYLHLWQDDFKMAIGGLQVHMCTVLYVCLQDCCFQARDRRMSSGTWVSICWLQRTVHPTAPDFCTACCSHDCEERWTLAHCSVMISWRPL